ncbi:MAG TPA: hypothetical protein VG146_15355 [Verrucomicrobiae bacterium]|nr:hypothetical protein [Verrucomicrobiae bacterium]
MPITRSRRYHGAPDIIGITVLYIIVFGQRGEDTRQPATGILACCWSRTAPDAAINASHKDIEQETNRSMFQIGLCELAPLLIICHGESSKQTGKRASNQKLQWPICRF